MILAVELLGQLLYAKKFENLGEMEKFLEKYNLPKLNQEAAESLNRPITAGDIKAVLKKIEIISSIFSDHNDLKLKPTAKKKLKSSQIQAD